MMVGNRHSDRRVFASFLHNYMTAAPSNLNESLAREDGAQASRSERTRSLPNLNLEPRDKNFGGTAAFYLARICRLKKQLDCFLKIVARRFDHITLAGYLEFRANPDITVTFPLNNRAAFLRFLHPPPPTFVL